MCDLSVLIVLMKTQEPENCGPNNHRTTEMHTKLCFAVLSSLGRVAVGV